MSLLAYLLALWGGFLLLLVVGFVSLVKLPKPVPERWEIRLFLLMGMPARQFLSYAMTHGVDPVFYHRALYGAYMSIMNSFFWIPREDARFPAEQVQSIEIQHDPIFIVGHYRSGTSLLHELLNRDEHMVAPNVYQCYTPRIFLWREDYIYQRFQHLQIARPMDRMKVGLDSAFEDEFALANLSGLSPYMGAIFPRQKPFYERYLSFKECTKEEVDRWKRTVLWFFKKVLYRHQDKRLILKSPSHTARIRLLLELFPNARFIHLTRDPYEIYQSTHRLHEKLLIQWCLQRPPLHDPRWRKDTILSHFRRMYDAYFEDVHLLRPDQLLDIRYDDLIKGPTATMRKVYDHFGLPGFEDVRPRLERYEEEQKGFQVNIHPKIPEADREIIRATWGDYFRRYGYAP